MVGKINYSKPLNPHPFTFIPSPSSLHPHPFTLIPSPSSLLLKPQNHAIDAIPQPCWGWSVIKHVSKMGLAFSALYFCSLHAMAVVWCVDDAFFRDWFKKAGPSTATVEFGIALEQCVATSGTEIGSFFIKFFKFAGPGPFRSLLPGDIILLRCQDLFPLLFS